MSFAECESCNIIHLPCSSEGRGVPVTAQHEHCAAQQQYISHRDSAGEKLVQKIHDVFCCKSIGDLFEGYDSASNMDCTGTIESKIYKFHSMRHRLNDVGTIYVAPTVRLSCQILNLPRERALSDIDFGCIQISVDPTGRLSDLFTESDHHSRVSDKTGSFNPLKIIHTIQIGEVPPDVIEFSTDVRPDCVEFLETQGHGFKERVGRERFLVCLVMRVGYESDNYRYRVLYSFEWMLHARWRKNHFSQDFWENHKYGIIQKISNIQNGFNDPFEINKGAESLAYSLLGEKLSERMDLLANEDQGAIALNV